MLRCTCTIHLGIQWPRIRCFRAYAQHQHGRLQGLCPTLPNLIFSCVPELLAQNKCKYSYAPELLAQDKSLIIQVLQSSLLNTNHQSPMCSIAPRSTQIINHSCAPELLAQHKSSITQLLQSFLLNTKLLINYVLQGPHPTQTSIYIYIYIINNCLTPNIYNKSSCSYVVGSSTQYIKTSR